MEKKFIKTYDLSDYEILTDTGFVDVLKLHETIPYTVFEIKLENGNRLKAADTHKLFDPEYNEVYLRDLKPGDSVLCEGENNDVVISKVEVIENLQYEETMYDFELPTGSNHRYFTNGILSHNTETAKTIAEEIFGPNTLIRFDMSEFMEKHTVSKLIGAPPGYVGYGEGGELTEAVRRKPFCVVLFDEIEKAHKDVFNVLLQILDEGFISDRQGRKVNFRNTVIVMTSNIGIKQAQEFGNGIGFETAAKASRSDAIKNNIERELKKFFAPEFLNRINDIITFNTLSESNIHDIVEIQLGRLRRRIEDAKYTFEWKPEVVDFIAKNGYQPEYGARPVERAILKHVEDEISEEMLRTNAPEGSKITASYVKKDDKIKITIK